MPKFILEKENQIQVLLVLFFILLVIIPGFLYFSFTDTLYKDERGILLDNKKTYSVCLNENTIFKKLPQILGRTIEFQKLTLPHTKEKREIMSKIKDIEAVQEGLPKVSRSTKDMNLGPILLILGRLYAKDLVKSPQFDKDMYEILRLTPPALAMCVDAGLDLNTKTRMGMANKRISFQSFKTIL